MYKRKKKLSPKSFDNESDNQRASSDPVFFTGISSLPCANSTFMCHSAETTASTSSGVSNSEGCDSRKRPEDSSNSSKFDRRDEKLTENTPSIGITEKVPKCNTNPFKSIDGGNSSKNLTMPSKDSEYEATAPFRLLSVTYGTEESNYRKKLKRISLGKIEWTKSVNIPYELDPRKIAQLKREHREKLKIKTSTINDNKDNDDIITFKKNMHTIIEDKFSSVNGETLDQDTEFMSCKTLVNGEHICTTDASTGHTVGENIVSSTDCNEQWERCKSDTAENDESIASSASTPGESPEPSPDSSLDPKTSKYSQSCPDLLDENRGASPDNIVIKKNIKLNSLSAKKIQSSQDLGDKGISSIESIEKENVEAPTNINSANEKTQDSSALEEIRRFIVQRENSGKVNSNSPQLTSNNINNNNNLHGSSPTSLTSLYNTSLNEIAFKMSNECDNGKSVEKVGEKQELTGLMKMKKKRKGQSSDLDKVNSKEVLKSSKTLSKKKMDEPDLKKKKKSRPDENLKESMKKEESLDNRKSYKNGESHGKYKSSSNSTGKASAKKRELDPVASSSISQEPNSKKPKLSESSSHSMSNSEKVSLKLKPREECNEFEKKTTPIGSSKKKRVSRLNLVEECGTLITGKIKEKLNRIKLKDKMTVKSSKSMNEPSLKGIRDETALSESPKGIIGETLNFSMNFEKNQPVGPQQRDNVAEKLHEKRAREDVEEESVKREKTIKKISREEPLQKASEKNSTSSGAHIRKDYLGRKLAKIAHDDKEKEKRIMAEIPKPASVVQRKKKESIPQVTMPASSVADVLAINASVPIDVHLFEDIDKKPLPPILPPAIPNNVFPKILQNSLQKKTDRIPLICEPFIPPLTKNLMDIDSLEREEFDEIHSPNSVETVILETSPNESEVEISPSNEVIKIKYTMPNDACNTITESIEISPGNKTDIPDFNDSNRTPSLLEKIAHLESQQIEFDKILKELELSETPRIMEESAIGKNTIDNNSKNIFHKKIATGSKDLELKSAAVLTGAEVKKHSNPDLVKSQPVMPIIIMPFPIMMSDQSTHLQEEEKEITKLYDDIIQLIQVTKYHRKRMETINAPAVEPQIKSLCETSMKTFKILKHKEKIRTDEEMIQLIVEQTVNSSHPWRINDEDVWWILKTFSATRPIAPVPPALIMKSNEKSELAVVPSPNNREMNNKKINNYQLTVEQKQPPPYSSLHASINNTNIHKIIDGEDRSRTNPTINPLTNSHSSNTRAFHSERIVSNQKMSNMNNHSTVLPRPRPNVNYHSPDQQKRFVAATQYEMQINPSVQQQMRNLNSLQNQRQPPLPNQPYPQVPPPPPPPPSSALQIPPSLPSLLPHDPCHQQFKYNHQQQQQQVMQNEQLVPQYKQHALPYFQNNLPQFGPHLKQPYFISSFNQSQSIPQQQSLQHIQQHPIPSFPQQFPPQNSQYIMNPGHYHRVPQNPIENLAYADVIPEDIKKCFSGQCKHPNCPRFLGCRKSIQSFQMSVAGSIQLPSRAVHAQLTGMQAQPNRDPRSKGGRVLQQQMQTYDQSITHQIVGNIMPKMPMSNISFQQQNIPLEHQNPSLQPLQNIQNQGKFLEFRDRQCNFQSRQAEFGSSQVGIQMSNSEKRESSEEPSNRKITQNEMNQFPKTMMTSISLKDQSHTSLNPSPVVQTKSGQTISNDLYRNTSVSLLSAPKKFENAHPSARGPIADAISVLKNHTIVSKEPITMSTSKKNCPSRSSVGEPVKEITSKSSSPTSMPMTNILIKAKVPKVLPVACTSKTSPVSTNEGQTPIPKQNDPILVEVATKISPPQQASANSNNTSKQTPNDSPLDLTTEKNLKSPKLLTLHPVQSCFSIAVNPKSPNSNISDVEVKSSKNFINNEKVKQEKTIDFISISSSSDDDDDNEEPEIMDADKSCPKFSRVDDEIECLGLAKELGIKLDENESALSSEPLGEEDNGIDFPVIGAVMTIPITDFEKMNVETEEQKNEIEIETNSFNEDPMEIIEEKPKSCITCNREVAVFCCSECHAELFCSRSCANTSDHFTSANCIPVVKIEDD